MDDAVPDDSVPDDSVTDGPVPSRAGTDAAAPRTAGVVVASSSAAAGLATDATGPVLVSWLRSRGFETPDAVVVADGAPVGDALRSLVEAGAAIVVTTGGTGVAPSDRTPEETLPLLDRSLPGVAEALRAAGAAQTPLAALGRGVAGIAGGTVVVNLPGSPAAVRQGIEVLTPLLDHVVQLAHEPEAHPHAHGDRRVTVASPRVGPGVVRAAVVEHPIALDPLAARVARDDAGAIATFTGVVRDHDGGRAVARLRYEAHPSADAAIAAVAAEIHRSWPTVTIAVEHRVGDLEIGDVAIAAAVSSAHRAEAFAAVARLVDDVKRDVPIWKAQRYADGTTEWVDPTQGHAGGTPSR